MSTDITIDGTEISTLGFYLRRVDGHKAIGEPKPQGSADDRYTSKNFNLGKYRQRSPEVAISLFGKFSTIAEGEAALYTLYGWLIQPGERTFVHTNGTATITFKGFMHRGASVDYKLAGAGIFFDIDLKILRTS